MKCEICRKRLQQCDANVTRMPGGAILYTCDSCHRLNDAEPKTDCPCFPCDACTHYPGNGGSCEAR